jgi:hypothetical protein
LISAPLQRQCFLYLSIFFMNVLCILKVHKLKVSQTKNTTFVICNILAWDKNMDLPANLLSHL